MGLSLKDTLVANISGSSGSCTGNAATATKLATARTISLTGSVTGSGSFDGSGNLSIATTTNHNHEIQNLTNFGARVYDATVSRTKNTVLAAPNGSNGVASFRALVAADLPSHTHSSTNDGTYNIQPEWSGSVSSAEWYCAWQDGSPIKIKAMSKANLKSQLGVPTITVDGTKLKIT